MTKRFRYFTIAILFLLIKTAVYSQEKWTTQYSFEYLNDLIRKTERLGYIIKTVSFSNETGKVGKVALSSAVQDTVFVIATAIVSINNAEIFSPNTAKLYLSAPDPTPEWPTDSDTVLLKVKHFETSVDRNNQKNIYTWRLALTPDQYKRFQKQKVNICCLSVSFTYTLPVAEVQLEGTDDEKYSKSKDRVQVGIVIFSKS